MVNELQLYDNEKIKNVFEKFKSLEYTNIDIEKILKNENSIVAKATIGSSEKYVEYTSVFLLMLKDIFSGKYKEIPKASITVIVFTLLYVLTPVDLIPDCIPVIGLVDDAAMIALCINFVSADVDKYKAWKENMEKLKNEYSED